ncbi:MAG: lytic transglycosylase domain-containing protein [Rhodospirillales bacterium]|nr:lytic transglycosylase domain-containing protein [Rhodospirillales bacterium]
MRYWGLWAAALLATWGGDALGAPTQVTESPWSLCRKETSKLERSEGIPMHLLTAISLAESGRWDETSRASAAWPWTVMAEGEGRFYDTKEQAVAEVRKLQRRGVSNIDVGCMQINLGYHGQHFANLEQAFDPAANTRYAAQYLKQMYGTAKDWNQAAGFYHSTTPERTEHYKTKVAKIWDNERRTPTEQRSAPVQTTAELIGRNFIDTARTAWLNQQFRTAREAERKTATTADPSEIRRKQMSAFRDARTSLVAAADLAARRRAEVESERKQVLDARLRTEAQNRVAQRRQVDLENWRRRVQVSASAAGES